MQQAQMIPWSQRSPVYPALQMQRPVTGLQLEPRAQLHTSRQNTPYSPAGHSALTHTHVTLRMSHNTIQSHHLYRQQNTA